MKKRIAGLLWLFCLNAFADDPVSIGDYASSAFNPSEAAEFSIPVEIKYAGRITVQIFSSDGDIVSTLDGGIRDEAGVYDISWAGRDDQNEIVPNEAYIPVVELVAKNNKVYTYDPRTLSGGEEVKITPQVSQQQIIFQLEKPSRILIRAGVKSGPMLNPIMNWQVRNAGRNFVPWNGFDQDQLVDLAKRDDLALLVTGFALPDHSNLTTGNDAYNYVTWRSRRDLLSSMPDMSLVEHSRNGNRISRHYYLPRSIDIDPRLTFSIVDNLDENEDGIPIVTGPVSLKVSMNDEDRWAMQQSLYEVAFFVDYKFLSEEEQGYVPLTWRWNPAGLSAGLHLISVNVSGFNGQVGVKSFYIEIPE